MYQGKEGINREIEERKRGRNRMTDARRRERERQRERKRRKESDVIHSARECLKVGSFGDKAQVHTK